RGGLPRACFVQAVIGNEKRWLGFRIGGDALANVCYFVRQHAGASWRLAQPKWNGRRRAVCILHSNAAGFDAFDAPRVSAEQEYVSGEALDGEILVQSPDGFAVRFRDHSVVCVLRNRSSGSDGGEARPAPALDTPVHLVAVPQCPGSSTRRRKSFGKHFDNISEILASEIAVRVGRTESFIEIVFRPAVRGSRGDDLLREDIERILRNFDAFEMALANR